jgi:hypothetical protein
MLAQGRRSPRFSWQLMLVGVLERNDLRRPHSSASEIAEDRRRDDRLIGHKLSFLSHRYRFEYSVWSAATHNMWQHIQVYDLRACGNPLHMGGHRVPAVRQLGSDPAYLLHAALYLDETMKAFATFRGVEPIDSPARINLEEAIDRLGNKLNESSETEGGDDHDASR